MLVNHAQVAIIQSSKLVYNAIHKIKIIAKNLKFTKLFTESSHENNHIKSINCDRTKKSVYNQVTSRVQENVVNKKLSHDLRFPTMWYVRPAKAQTSLRIRTVWSEPLLGSWIFSDYYANEWTPFGVSKL